jgi:hypothetical protein
MLREKGCEIMNFVFTDNSHNLFNNLLYKTSGGVNHFLLNTILTREFRSLYILLRRRRAASLYRKPSWDIYRITSDRGASGQRLDILTSDRAIVG